MVVRVLEGSPRGASAVVALFSIVYAIAATQAGRTAERFANQYRPLIGSNVVMGTGLISFAFAPTIAIAVFGGVIFGAGYGLTSSLYRSILPGLAPEPLRGGLVSTAETLGRVGATISPIFIGILISMFEPAVGFTDAVRWSVFSIGAFVGVFGVIAVSISALLEKDGTT